MPTLKTIDVHIDAAGNVSIETSGFTGSECTKATKGLEEALGTVESRNMKPESLTTTTVQRTIKTSS